MGKVLFFLSVAFRLENSQHDKKNLKALRSGQKKNLKTLRSWQKKIKDASLGRPPSLRFR